MSFYAVDNGFVLTQSVVPYNPWEFSPSPEQSAQITAQIRHDKDSRQLFYRNFNTKWNFYTPLEGCNPNQRISKEDNPPRFSHGIALDFDVKIAIEYVRQQIEQMVIKPSWIETSLGGKVRLVWLFEQKLLIDTCDFYEYFQRAAAKWLKAELLPGLDEGALTEASRLLCNGAVWESTGAGPIPHEKLQAFFVKTAGSFRFKSSDTVKIPLDVVEAGLRKKFDNFNWPVNFAVDSQGPSFWIPASTSPLSAIVKEEGMVTFSAHRDKTFYPWGDESLLGKEFVQAYTETSISKATSNIYYDKKNYWQWMDTYWDSVPPAEMNNYLENDCGLSMTKDKTGKSTLRSALSHIHKKNRVIGGAPFCYRPSGPIIYQGNRIINTYRNRAIKPATGTQKMGPHGNFPFLSAHWETLLITPLQMWYYLAWGKHMYMCAIDEVARSGTNVFLLGEAGKGKTMTGRGIWGKLMGGWVDASRYLLENAHFTSEFHEVPLWCSDDDSSTDNPAAQARFQSSWKKVAANQEFLYHKKFEVPVTIVHPVRIHGSYNLDQSSIRIVGPMDNSSKDKSNLLRCAPGLMKLPPREELEKIIENELPYFGRWLYDVEIPDFVERDVRFGYKSYHDESLLDSAHQSSKCGPFKELLLEYLETFFKTETAATRWRGTATALLRCLHSHPFNEQIMRSMKLEQVTRYLEMIQREGLVKCTSETNEMKCRVWVFERFGSPATPPQTIPPLTNQPLT
jgi:hypothetical protein